METTSFVFIWLKKSLDQSYQMIKRAEKAIRFLNVSSILESRLQIPTVMIHFRRKMKKRLENEKRLTKKFKNNKTSLKNDVTNSEHFASFHFCHFNKIDIFVTEI